MLSKLAALATLALTVLAVATPAARVASRNDPTVACCTGTEAADSAAGARLLSLLGIILPDVNVLLALECSPISIFGAGSGSACSGTTVSCSGGIIDGIGLACVPIIV
ncbi:fungal hydrophobin [Phanerochaete sordida]|uniref:Hydrophobin n=1 Tax=Phanerochaete sordida TaxID=48140 RepID=A0A9P3GKC7_9APHY|nr:fungal hydrophobin [Phanerochaete sordida]